MTEAVAETPPQMTLGALRTTCELVLRDLHLGDRCMARSSAYSDYVALTFYVPQPTAKDAEAIDRWFKILTDRYGWLESKAVVHERSNTISVTLMRSKLISTSDRRMPL